MRGQLSHHFLLSCPIWKDIHTKGGEISSGSVFIIPYHLSYKQLLNIIRKFTFSISNSAQKSESQICV